MESSRITPAKFKHTLRVSYAHCTLGNHVYYARYLDLLELARGEFFRAIGHSCLALQNEGTIFQVTECALKYLKPARYDDELTITLSLSEIRKVRLRFDYEVLRAGELLLTGWTYLVCATTEEKPQRIPSPLLAAFEPYSAQPNPASAAGTSLTATLAPPSNRQG